MENGRVLQRRDFMRKRMIFETGSPEETFALGRKLGTEAVPGEIICLNGDLGTGKTVFTQALHSVSV